MIQGKLNIVTVTVTVGSLIQPHHTVTLTSHHEGMTQIRRLSWVTVTLSRTCSAIPLKTQHAALPKNISRT